MGGGPEKLRVEKALNQKSMGGGEREAFTVA